MVEVVVEEKLNVEMVQSTVTWFQRPRLEQRQNLPLSVAGASEPFPLLVVVGCEGWWCWMPG